MHDDVYLLFADAGDVGSPLDGLGEQLLTDARVETNYVEFYESFLTVFVNALEPVYGGLRTLPLVGVCNGPDIVVDPVQDGFANHPDVVLGWVNEAALK